MSQIREKTDVVIVGLGWAGSVMAEELTRAGLNVVAIERGAWRDTSTDFPVSVDPDELRYHTRREILQPMSIRSTTFRNNSQQDAAPVRNWSAFELAGTLAARVPTGQACRGALRRGILKSPPKLASATVPAR